MEECRRFSEASPLSRGFPLIFRGFQQFCVKIRVVHMISYLSLGNSTGEQASKFLFRVSFGKYSPLRVVLFVSLVTLVRLIREHRLDTRQSGISRGF